MTNHHSDWATELFIAQFCKACLSKKNNFFQNWRKTIEFSSEL